MVPRSLDEWTLERVRELLEKHYQEAETFDWKERLPHSKDHDGKERLKRACAGFANGRGGFLVFGVKDDAGLSASERLVGIPPENEFNRDFGNFPSDCKPSVYWEARSHPIKIEPNGRVLHVVQIPQSWRAPHAVGKPDSGFVFPLRTNKSDEFLPYHEVQRMFLSFYEKRIKLQLMKAELVRFREEAQALVEIKSPAQCEEFRPITYSLQILETVLGDTYTILVEVPDLVTLLSRLRADVQRLNVDMSRLSSELTQLPLRPAMHQPWRQEDQVAERVTIVRNYVGSKSLSIINRINTTVTEALAKLEALLIGDETRVTSPQRSGQ